MMVERSAHREPWPLSCSSYTRCCRCEGCTAANATRVGLSYLPPGGIR